jgi:transcriptional regulator of acetoin/glycerol metabolism
MTLELFPDERCRECLSVENCVGLYLRIHRQPVRVCFCASCLIDCVGMLVGYRVRDVEGALVRRVVESSRDNKSRAARVLGIHRRSLYRRLSSERRA